MRSVKAYFLCNTTWKYCAACKMRTHAAIMAPRKTNSKLFDDSELRHKKMQFFKNNTENVENLGNFEDDEFESEEADLMKIDTAFDHHIWEAKREKNHLKKKIIGKVFFKPAPQPQMLTYYDKEQIKFLHNQDPIQWNVKALSESFPATPDIIQKVLKANWKPSLQKQEKINKVVIKNWELLEKGELDADPKFIEHLKKFTNRKQIISQQLQNPSFYLPHIKEKEVWNNGEMNSIIANYEKAVIDLENKRLQQSNNKVVINESKPNKILESPVFEKNENDSFIAYKKHLREKPEMQLEKKESFMLRKVVNTFKNDLIVDKVEKNSVKSSENKKCSNLYENVSIDNKLRKNKLTDLVVKQKFTSVVIKNEDNNKNEEVENLGEEENNLFNEEENASNEEEKLCNIDEEDLKNTAFWDSKKNSKEKMLIEKEKKSLQSPKNIKEITKADISSDNFYPNRIKIPKSKRGSGLTFKVNDCYYDDDGEFLYRVPGMIK